MALLTVLTGATLLSGPPLDPQLVQAMQAEVCLHRLHELPLVLPDKPDARRRTVLVDGRRGGTDCERPALAGLAWALGVRYPHIRAVVKESVAAAATISAGAMDPDLLRRGAMDAAPIWAAQVLAKRQNLTDPALIARAAEWATTAAQSLIHRLELTTPQMNAIAAE